MQHAMAYSVIMSPLGVPAPQICVDVESDSKLWTIEDVVHHVLLFPTWNPGYLQLLVASTTTRFDRVETLPPLCFLAVSHRYSCYDPGPHGIFEVELRNMALISHQEPQIYTTFARIGLD
jgi:hypothetical protein